MNEVLTSSDGATFSEPTTSQWKALVRGFLEAVLNLKGKGGGAGMPGGDGLFTTGKPDSWLRGSETDLDGVKAVWAGDGGGKTGEDEGTALGEVGGWMGGETLGPVTWTGAFLTLRGLGTGLQADEEL